jgi:hypothetical protein
MSPPDSPAQCKIRCDGWTPDRQLRFLDALVSTRSVANAAAFAGMSREGAYRLRNRSEGTLFALLWNRAFAPERTSREVHTAPPTDGQIMRLLGTHYRREREGFSASGPTAKSRR